MEAVVAGGTISFNVTAPLSRGEQVMVCGDAAFLGGWQPEKALPLYTTPGDYPAWSAKEDVPMPPGDCTGYRYCIFRGGKFFRWEKVSRPRTVRPPTILQIERDILDQEPADDRENGGNFPFGNQISVAAEKNEPEEKHADLQHRKPWEMAVSESSALVEDAPMAENTQDHSSGSSPDRLLPIGHHHHHHHHHDSGEDATVSVPNDEGSGLALVLPGSVGWDFRVGSGTTTAVSRDADVVGNEPNSAATTQTMATASSTTATSGLETPSFVAASVAATAAACLEASGVVGIGDIEGMSPTSLLRLRIEQQRQEVVESCIGEGVGVTLRRPPSLEAEEGDGGGLGLGLRLGVEAMSSPPPRMEVSRGSPNLWSPRNGGVVVASYYLPVIISKSEKGEWSAQWDREQILSLQANMRVVRVGTVKKSNAPIMEDDKPAVVQALSKLNCIPVFLTEALHHQSYYQYCKGILWPVMHNILEMYDDLPNSLLDPKAIAEGWQAYKQVNKAFRDKVVEVYHDGDMIWVHGFHLAILPGFLERRVKVARIGLFLHTPFPPSEVFRALPQREELLRGMLGADQVGFHRFIDGRHFTSSCRRLLGLQHIYNKETGLLQIINGGKPVILSTGHSGVEPEVVRAALAEPDAQEEEARLKTLHGDRIVLAGVEKVERLKGVWLKILAFDNMLRLNPELVGRVAMHEVGITNQARGSDYRACRSLVSNLAERVNVKYGKGTIVYEERQERDIDLARRVALMGVSSVFVKTPVHDGLSTTPMEYRIVQEHKAKVVRRARAPSRVPGVLVLSEAVSCLQALRGCLPVNPWQVEAVAEAMTRAVNASTREKLSWHEDDIEWCESHTTTSWAEGVLADLCTVPKENRTRYATTGLGLTSRVVGTDPTFKRLSTDDARRAYSSSKSRVFFLDYGGTIAKDNTNTSGKAQQEFEKLGSLHGEAGSSPEGSSRAKRFQDNFQDKKETLEPGSHVLEALEDLCGDSRNLVFVVSGRGKEELEEAFGHIKGLGLAAEHGSFFRWPSMVPHDTDGNFNEGETKEAGGWQVLHPGIDNNAWKEVARRFMKDFQMHTYGSYMEEKGTSMLWHYGNADPEFGALQAKKLQDELTEVLCASSPSNTTAEGMLISGRGKKGGSRAAAVRLGLGRKVSYPRYGDCDVEPTSAPSLGLALSTSSAVKYERPGEEVEAGAIEITHEEGRNWDAGGGGAYLEVRARGASKGRFVHMVLSKLGWRPRGDGGGEGTAGNVPGSRFCLCVGDDVSDEDMFLALKSYGTVGSVAETETQNRDGRALGWQQGSKDNLTSASNEKRPQSLLTVTVGSKPSDADAWLPGVDAVISLLRTLARATQTARRDAHMSTAFSTSSLMGTSLSHPTFHFSTPPPAMDMRGSTPPPSIHSTHAYSYGNPPSALVAAPAALGSVSETPSEGGDGGEAWPGSGDTWPSSGMAGVVGGVEGLQLGQGVPVVRRHSYTLDGKPRISLSLNEFLRVVAQPEPEPPMF